MYDNTQSGLNSETIIALIVGRMTAAICRGRKYDDET
jgi:hypothetical protein